MGKQKPKRLASNDTEQILSREGLAHSRHSSERKLNTGRTIINNYEDNLRGCQEGRQAVKDNRSRRETTGGSRKRSKSLTSMGRRKTDKKSYEVKSTKSTETSRTVAYHSSLRRSSLSEKKKNFEQLLKPILKRDGEVSAVGKVRGNGELATEGRKVSLVTNESHPNGRKKPERDSLTLPRSSKGRSKQSLAARIETDKAEVKELTKRMEYKRAVLVGNTRELMSSSIDVPDIDSGSPLSAQLVQLDENGNTDSERYNYHRGKSNRVSGQSFGTAVATEHKQTLEGSSKLTLSSPKSLHSDYKEIWIGSLPEPPKTNNLDLLHLCSTNFASFHHMPDFQPLPTEEPERSVSSSRNMTEDLIDFSVELPSQSSTADVNDSPLHAISLVTIGGKNTPDSTLTESLSEHEDDALISRLLEKVNSSKESLYSDGDETSSDQNLITRSDNSYSMFGASNSQRKILPVCSLVKSSQIPKDFSSVDQNELLLSASRFNQDAPCTKSKGNANPIEVVVAINSQDRDELEENDVESGGTALVPPPCTFGRVSSSSDSDPNGLVGNESGLSPILASSADNCVDTLPVESSDSHLIAISATDEELSSVHSVSTVQLSSSYQPLIDNSPAFSSSVKTDTTTTCHERFGQQACFSSCSTEKISGISSYGETENFQTAYVEEEHSDILKSGKHSFSASVASPGVLDTCPPLRKSFSSSHVKSSELSPMQSNPLEVQPVVEVKDSRQSEPKIEYSTLPRIALPQRLPRPRSQSLDLEIDVDAESQLPFNDADDFVNKTQSLTVLNLRKTSQSQISRGDSFSERFGIPFRISKMFSKKKKSVIISNDTPNGSTSVMTVDSLYSDWLAETGKNITPRRRGEGVRTVVLARTKKGYGFVLRGAKAEQLKKLDVQFVASEKMPALQYLDSVEKGSVSDKAGLRAGDFILEIDGVNVVHASHEQTVQVIKKAGDVLAMKVVRAVITQENGGGHLANGFPNGSATLPHKKMQKNEAHQGSSSVVLTRKSNPEMPNSISKDDENSAIEQLDAALANYDSDSRSSGSGANQGTGSPVKVAMREQKTASIRQRPSSSHFNSIQELDDMFAAPAALPPAKPPSEKAETRKPDNGHGPHADIPRTMSGDLSTLQRKSNNTATAPAVTTAMPPPPPSFPAPLAPDDDKISTASSSSNAGSHTGYCNPLPNQPENKRFLPRTPLPTDNTDTINSSRESSIPSGFGTFQRGKTPPPPPQRMSSHDYAIITVPGTTVQSVGEKKTSSFETPKPTSSFSTPAADDAIVSSPFSEAIRKAAAERETDRSANNNTADASNDIYAAVQKRQARLASADTNNSHVTSTSSSSKPGAVSVEDQLKMAVAKRRTVIERQDTTDSDRSTSNTPERTLTQVKGSDTGKSGGTNYLELAKQKRQQYLKEKADSKDQLLPPPPAMSSSPKQSDSSTEESMTELQKIMSRLSVAKADEPNNNTKKKIPPPVTHKKPEKPLSPTSLQNHRSPVEEFPPPPPPHDFGPDATDVIIPPPSFEMPEQFGSLTPPPPLSSPSHSLYPNKSEPVHHHDADNHSVTSSAGSDTISSVSQDGNRLSVATSGYGSDPNRGAKLSFSGKNVESWSGEEVGEWLESIGLGEYKTVFAENCIEGETLVSMTKSDIKELGVEKVGHRVKLDKEIKKILAENNP